MEQKEIIDVTLIDIIL